jgi:Putative transposase.
MGRYIRHPVIANSRIESYDGHYVTFWYNDHVTGEKQYRKMEVMDFISAVVGHIPDRNFKTYKILWSL